MPDSSSIVRGMPTTAIVSVPDISIIIPAYNEQDNLVPLLMELCPVLDALPRVYEILLIDDGSSDGTLSVMRGLAQEYDSVRYLSFERNTGQSAAFAAGFQEAKGAVCITMDADRQNDPADIPTMLALYDQGYDMVIGWRARREDSFAKRVSSRIANAARNALSHENVKDTGCSLKIMRTAMARRLPMFTGMHRFLPTLMKMHGAAVAEIRVNHRPRVAGVSKYGVWDRAFSALRDLFAVRWMQSRAIRYTIKERR